MTRTNPMLTGSLTAAVMLLVTWALAAGFDVSPLNAVVRALPLVVIGAVIAGFATAVLRHELA